MKAGLANSSIFKGKVLVARHILKLAGVDPEYSEVAKEIVVWHKPAPTPMGQIQEKGVSWPSCHPLNPPLTRTA